MRRLVDGIAVVYLYVSDMSRSLVFYRDLLGIPLEGDQHWAEATLRPGVRFALHAAPEDQPPQTPGTVWIDFEVSDIDDAVARLRTAGVKVGEVSRQEFGDFVTVHDPDGYAIELFHRPQSRKGRSGA